MSHLEKCLRLARFNFVARDWPRGMQEPLGRLAWDVQFRAMHDAMLAETAEKNSSPVAIFKKAPKVLHIDATGVMEIEQ